MQTNQDIVNIVSISLTALSLFVGVISLHTHIPDYDKHYLYEQPAISVDQHRQPVILQDPYSRDFLIQPTGTEHDRPVVSMRHLNDYPDHTLGKPHPSVKIRSINGTMGAYQSIVRRPHG